MAFRLGAFQADAFQIGQIDWMSALSEPPANSAPRAHRAVAYQQHEAFVSQYFQHIPDENIGWFRALSEPSTESLKYRGKRPVPVFPAYFPADPEENETPGEGGEFDWFFALSEPYLKVGQPVPFQQSNIEVTPFELLSEGTMEWFSPLAEPYKKVRDPVVWQQSYIEPDVEETIEPGAGTEYDWFFALSEPSKFLERPALTTAIQATYCLAFQKGDPFIYDHKNLVWIIARHDEQVDLIGKHLTGSSLIRATAFHKETISLTAWHSTTINKSSVHQVDGETNLGEGAFQADAFYFRAFGGEQSFSNSLIVRVLTGKK